jgi:hypothetical protein
MKPLTTTTITRGTTMGNSLTILHPLLASPIKGEVQMERLAPSNPTHRPDTSPLMGEAGRGCRQSPHAEWSTPHAH